MRLIFKEGEPQAWIKAGTAWEKMMAKAATAAVKDTGEAARDAVRRNIQAAGFGPRWTASIRSIMKPKTGDVLNPFAWVHSTKNFADVFETGKTIQGHEWLWIPTPAVPPWPGDPTRQMSPKKFVEATGQRLFSLKGTRRPYLAAVGFFANERAASSGKISAKNFSTAKGARISRVTILFIGVNEVTIEKRFNAYAAIQKEVDQLPDRYAKEIAPLEATYR